MKIVLKKLKKIFRFIRNVLTLRYVRKKIELVIKKSKFRKIVHSIESGFTENTVYIFQHAMFDRSGEKCFNGGAERYVKDLGDILMSRGLTPVLIQIGNKKLWSRKIGNLTIFGVPADSENYLLLLQQFTKYKFVIYSGYVNWGKKIHPNILISHGVTWDKPAFNVDTKKILSIISDADNFISVDTNTVSWLRATFSKTLEHKNMKVIPNYVDTSIYKPANKPEKENINICFPRRACKERGYWLMSAALPPIMEKYPNVNFDFVGFAHGDDIVNDLKELMNKFPGRINHYALEPEEMITAYQRADISLVPTLYAEGTSLSCLEAQACGNVVIATNIGGLPNLVIDGYNGMLINPDGKELMIALDKVISNPKLRDKLSKNAVDVAAVFDKKIWINRWGNIVDDMGK